MIQNACLNGLARLKMGDLVTLDYDNNYDNDDDGYLAVKVRLSWDSMTPLGGPVVPEV